MIITLKRKPEEQYLLEYYKLILRALRGETTLNLASALKAVEPATSTNTPEEAGSILEQLAEEGVISIDYNE